MQLLCEELDPLEATYADVRFIDVDYDQTEKQYNIILSDLSKEINDENQFNNEANELQQKMNKVIVLCESNNFDALKNCQLNTLPALKLRFEFLQKVFNDYLTQRKMVKSEFLIKNNANNLIENVNKTIEQLEQQQLDVIISKLHNNFNLLPIEPTEDELHVFVKELNQLPQDNINVIQLNNRINEIKNEKIRKEKVKKDLDKKIQNIAEKINSISEKYLIASKVDKKKRKQKKKTTPSASVDRNTEIEELRLDIDNLQTEIIPTINQLNDKLVSEKIEIPLCYEQQSNSIELLENLQVCYYIVIFLS